MTREPTANFIPALTKQDTPYTLGELEKSIDEIFNSNYEVINNPHAKVVVNYLVPDPVSSAKISMSGSLSLEPVDNSNFSLNISLSHPDNIYFIPDERVINGSMTIGELAQALKGTGQGNIHVHYLDQCVKRNQRYVGVVAGFSFLRVHHSETLDGVFILDLKVETSP